MIKINSKYTIQLAEADYEKLKTIAYENNTEIEELISEMINEKTELLELDFNLNKAPDSFNLLANDEYLSKSDSFKDKFNEV
ncbi:hypothetical protein [Orenia marismortui]|uniref:hypothetical protein n=1 Tax=Orenia marismortui TaxID=46469 RepID=UPI00035E23FC|nr:hypothetical protein [Orenia marismortui]